MRVLRLLTGFFAVAAVALSVFAPRPALAQSVGFPYYGGIGGGAPLLPCTGFWSGNVSKLVLDADGKPQVDAQGKPTGATTSYPFRAVTSAATGNLEQCTSLCDVFTFVNRALILALSVLVTIILPIMIMVGAGYIITGGGNPGQRAQGMKIIQGTVVGLVITICGFFIVNQLLQLIFENGYGEALRQAAKDQDLGISATEIDNLFNWDNLSCSVAGLGTTIKDTSVSVTTGANLKAKTGSGTTPTKQPTVLCGTKADKTNKDFSCVSGWTTSPACTGTKPYACNVSASNACVSYCAKTYPGWSWTGLVRTDPQQPEKCYCFQF